MHCAVVSVRRHPLRGHWRRSGAGGQPHLYARNLTRQAKEWQNEIRARNKFVFCVSKQIFIKIASIVIIKYWHRKMVCPQIKVLLLNLKKK